MQSLKRAIRRGGAVISHNAVCGNFIVRKRGSTVRQWVHGVRNAVVDAGNVDVSDRYNGHAEYF